MARSEKTQAETDLIEALPELVPPAPAPVPAPTLEAAFTLLCQAMEAHYVDDVPTALRCQEIQGWYANGNVVVGWREAIRLLEQMLGLPLQVG